MAEIEITLHSAFAEFSAQDWDALACPEAAAGGSRVAAEDVDHLQEAPPLWWVCFEVDDADTAAERVVAAGGALVQEPEEFLSKVGFRETRSDVQRVLGGRGQQAD